MKLINTLLHSLIISTCIAFPIYAGELTIPVQFTAGTPAVATEVNANFTSVEVAVDGNATDIVTVLETINALSARINVLEINNTELQISIETMQVTIDSLDSTVASFGSDNAIMQNFIAEVLPYIEGATDAQGHSAIYFSGVNVHINNGDGATESVNGSGNLIVGYDESYEFDLFGPEPFNFCTRVEFFGGSAYQTQEICESNGGTWGDNSQKIGSHNLIVGLGHSYTQSGGLVSGKNNTISGRGSNISGGTDNVASGGYSSISAGFFNQATGPFSGVVGGLDNIAQNDWATVFGGFRNEANGWRSSVFGGARNVASMDYSSVSGGVDNLANGRYSSVSGGKNNIASGETSSVSGGEANRARGESSSISGGNAGIVTTEFDWRAGTLFETE